MMLLSVHVAMVIRATDLIHESCVLQILRCVRVQLYLCGVTYYGPQYRRVTCWGVNPECPCVPTI